MKIGLASDHGGFELKEEIIKHLEGRNIEYVDYGTKSKESVDYPEYGRILGEKVMENEVDRGIAICGTGIGISISCNKVKGIRAALCSDTFSARMSREHNDSNILALGERVLGKGLAIDIVDIWLDTEFAGGRHERRVKKIAEIEE